MSVLVKRGNLFVQKLVEFFIILYFKGSGANKGYLPKNNEDSYWNRSLRC